MSKRDLQRVEILAELSTGAHFGSPFQDGFPLIASTPVQQPLAA